MRVIFLKSYARILTYETSSYVNHVVEKNTRSTLLVGGKWRFYAGAGDGEHMPPNRS